ncbi:MAG TPA: selenide, water dikinase SelD [Solirubrobacteraceae bacterium]|nr:selenide, water dikinase SelD [Solirubrobacteraceae bacterium]
MTDSHAAVPVALTSLSHGAGCGCKLPAAALLPIVQGLPAVVEPRLLVGSNTADDAAVFQLTDEIALVMTIDFFTPIVDDPYDFGRIAAANALSDVYAMGGVPLAAMNVVAFPLEQLGGDVLREILRGGADVASAAGIAVVGGHSIDDPEPKYGMSVTGTVHPDALISNAGARAGDVLVLTKPLGVGAITTARKRGLRDDDLLARAVETMTALNDAASAAARAAGAHAMTDVTGFGLLGHLHSLGRARGVSAVIDAAAVPAIDGVPELLAGDDAVSGGSRRNREYAETFTAFDEGVPESRRRLVCDATTSGGLLVAVPGAAAGGVPGVVVGEIVAGAAGAIAVQ